MNALFVTVRAVHFASAMLLFGELVFVLCVAKPGWRAAGNAILDGNDVSRWPVRIAVWGLVASIASGVAWLAIEAALMSGMPLEAALNRTTVALVLGETLFGRVWLLRAAVGISLGVLLTAIIMARDDRRRSRLTVGAAVLAGVYLATLAWAGHAAAGPPEERSLHLTSDAVHLLAAGAWLGALPGLAFLLGRAQRISNVPSLDTAADVTRRFSTLGVVSVGALLLSGLANTWYLVGDVPALVGTDYGRLLLAKLALFAAMITLAFVNRLRLTPRLHTHDRAALRGLRRNALLEAAAGLLVLALVGVLGITVPAAHQAPVWPFAYTLSLEPVYEAVGLSTALVFAASVALVAAGIAVRGFRTRRSGLWISGLAGICVAASSSAWLLAVPAHPTSYLTSPVRYTTTSIVSGSARYARDCSACHGSHGRDGRAAASLAMKTANLLEYASHHRAGDVFWVIAHGIPGTPMPAFAPQLTDSEIWELIQYLRAQSEATDARALNHRVEPWRPIVAPDFTFEIDAQPQESLRKQRERFVTQLVFYTLPDSLPRLRELATEKRAFAAAGVRVIAVPLVISSTSPDAETVNDGKSIFAITRPDVAMAYAIFARRGIEAGDDAPTHVEFLIDRQGYLRARWIGVPAAATDRTGEILSQIKQLDDERVRAPPPAGHAH